MFVCSRAARPLLTTQNYLRLLTNERDIGPDDKLPPEYLPCFQDLWADSGVQLAMLKGNEYALHDNLN